MGVIINKERHPRFSRVRKKVVVVVALCLGLLGPTGGQLYGSSASALTFGGTISPSPASGTWRQISASPANQPYGVWTTLGLGSRGPAVLELEKALNSLAYNVGMVGDQYSSLTRQAVEQFQRDYGLPVNGKVDYSTWQAIQQAARGIAVQTPPQPKPGQPGSFTESPAPGAPGGQAAESPPASPTPTPAPTNPPPTPGPNLEERGDSTEGQDSPGPAIYRLGSRGQGVLEVERLLNSLGYNVGLVADQYSSLTREAVRQFQRANGLPVTGEVDARTLELLRAKAAGKGSGASPVTGSPGVGNQYVAPPNVIPGATGSSSPTTQPPPHSNPAGSGGGNSLPFGMTAEEAEMLSMVNQERSLAGLSPLTADDRLVTLARVKSLDMITNGYFGHISPTYGSPFEMLTRAGVNYRSAGENLAGARSVSQAHQNLMNSPGHRANILDPIYQYIGIGIVDGGPYGKMFTQLFVGR